MLVPRTSIAAFVSSAALFFVRNDVEMEIVLRRHIRSRKASNFAAYVLLPAARRHLPLYGSFGQVCVAHCNKELPKTSYLYSPYSMYLGPKGVPI